jgi:hypothetical protein
MPMDPETLQDLPEGQSTPVPAEPPPPPAKVKKARKKRAPNKPKVKPVDDRPVDIPEDHPALVSEPDPDIDAVAAAKRLIAARQMVAAAEAQNEQPKNVPIREIGMTLAVLQVRLDEARNRPKPEPFTPPRTARQQETVDAEMAAGQRRTAHFAEQEKLRQQLAPDPNAATTTPVHRPGDWVPDINSKDPATGAAAKRLS